MFSSASGAHFRHGMFFNHNNQNQLQVIIEDESKSDETVEEWECSFCTFLNSGEDRIKCGMCQGERSEGGESAHQPEMQKKQCPFCTLLNKPHCEKCEACEGVLN